MEVQYECEDIVNVINVILLSLMSLYGPLGRLFPVKVDDGLVPFS